MIWGVQRARILEISIESHPANAFNGSTFPRSVRSRRFTHRLTVLADLVFLYVLLYNGSCGMAGYELFFFLSFIFCFFGCSIEPYFRWNPANFTERALHSGVELHCGCRL